MSSFICKRCKKPFNQKIHLINHLKRKKSCPLFDAADTAAAPADISTETLLEDLLSGHKKQTAAAASTEQEQSAAATAAPAVITNSGGINLFIFPGLNGAEPGETKILSSTNFNDIGAAINSLLGFIVNKPATTASASAF
jgi:hypothetical protein